MTEKRPARRVKSRTEVSQGLGENPSVSINSSDAEALEEIERVLSDTLEPELPADVLTVVSRQHKDTNNIDLGADSEESENDALQRLKIDTEVIKRGDASDPAQNSGQPRVRDFNEWVPLPNSAIEAFPDHCFYQIYREHPTEDQHGNYIGGHIRTVHEPISLEWMRRQFPEGGRYTVQLRGPRNGKVGTILTTFTSLRLAALQDERPQVRGKEKEERPVPTTNAEDGFTKMMATRYVESWEDTKKRLEGDKARLEGELRKFKEQAVPAPPRLVPPAIPEAERTWRNQDLGPGGPLSSRGPITLTDSDVWPSRGMSPIPKHVEQSVPQHDPMAAAFSKLVEAMTAKSPSSGGSTHEVLQEALQAVRQENLRLHDAMNSLRTAHREEIAERLKEQREALMRELEEQRRVLAERIRDVTEASRETLATLREQHRAELDQLKESHRERVEQHRDVVKALDEQSRRTADEVASLRDKLHEARTEATEKGARLAALETTRTSEIEVIRATARAEAAEKSRDAQQKDTDSSEPRDPVDRMVSTLVRAKELSRLLSDSLGDGGTKEVVGALGAPSKVDRWVDVASKVAGSKEIKGLVGAAAEALSRGVAQAVRPKQEIRMPSTEAIAASRRLPLPSQMRSRPSPQPGPQPGPQPSPVEPPVAIITPVAEIPSDDMDMASTPGLAEIKQAAEQMLDEIEEHTANQTPVDEATEEMIRKLQGISGASREDIVSGLKGTTAEGTLESLGLPKSRLSSGALAYFNKLIGHALS